MPSLISGLLCCLWLFCACPLTAAEPESVFYAPPPLYTVASFRIPALMESSQLIGAYGKSAYPKFADYVVLGTIALTMNPELADYDLTAPVAIDLVYNPRLPPGAPDRFIYLLALKSKRKELAGQSKIFGFHFIPAANHAGTVVLTTSKSISPLAVRPVPMPRPGGWSLRLDRKTLSGAFNLPDVVLPILRSEVRTPSVEEQAQWERELKILSVKLSAFDDLLAQFDTIALDMEPVPEALTLHLTLTPARGSVVESLPVPTPDTEKFRVRTPAASSVTAVLDLHALSDDAYKTLCRNLLPYWERCCAQSGESPLLRQFGRLLIQSAYGRISGSAGFLDHVPFTTFTIPIRPDAARTFRNLWSAFPATDRPAVRLIRTFDTVNHDRPEKLYCVRGETLLDSPVLVFGALTPAESELLLKRSAGIDFHAGPLFMVRQTSAPTASPDLFALFRKEQSLNMKLNMNPGSLQSFLSLIRPLF